jgi:acyl dehydratase
VNDQGLRYFEDYAPGVACDCGAVSIDAASIFDFGKKFDPQSFHTDPVAAVGGPFGGVGVDEIRWPYPVRPGDTLRACPRGPGRGRLGWWPVTRRDG